jgi:Holliday junction resolvase RusA-like endonuclease
MIEMIIPETIVPYTRMTQRSKFVDRAAQKYLVNRETLRWYMRQAMACCDQEMYDRTPLCCTLEFSMPKIHKADLDNLIKAVLDAAQSVIFKNDRWVEHIVASQNLAEEPKLYFKVEEMCKTAPQPENPID